MNSDRKVANELLEAFARPLQPGSGDKIAVGQSRRFSGLYAKGSYEIRPVVEADIGNNQIIPRSERLRVECVFGKERE